MLFRSILHAHIQAQALQFLDQHAEALGDAGLGNILALDDGLVGLDTTGDVVGLDGQDLLQGCLLYTSLPCRALVTSAVVFSHC